MKVYNLLLTGLVITIAGCGSGGSGSGSVLSNAGSSSSSVSSETSSHGATSSIPILPVTGSSSSFVSSQTSSYGATSSSSAASSISSMVSSLSSSSTGGFISSPSSQGISSSSTGAFHSEAPLEFSVDEVIKIAENERSVVTLSSNQDVSFSIGGADAAHFEINADSYNLSFVARPNFEAPHDANADNQYDITLTASTSGGQQLVRNLTVVVYDLALPKTGQTQSYAQTWGLAEGSVKDDGYYQAGKARTFMLNDASSPLLVIADGAQSLLWFTLANQSYTHAASACPTAVQLIRDWRLPTSAELFYLTEKRDGIHPMIDPIFEHSEEIAHWSSDAVVGVSPKHWSVEFGRSTDVESLDSEILSAFCVHGNAPEHEWVTQGDVVIDRKTDLMWQNNSDNKAKDRVWLSAVEYCEQLGLGGFEDWRLPNINELYSLIEREFVGTTFPEEMTQMRQRPHWSSTSIGQNTAFYTVNFENTKAELEFDNINDRADIRCVRGY